MNFESNLSTISYRSSPGLGIELPAKSIIINEEKLYIISPMNFDGETVEGIKMLNPSPIFIAPNNYHHLHLAHAKKLFPDSLLYGPEGAAKKSGIELLPIEELEFKESLFPHSIRGNPQLEETCFFHPASKTLILTDLLFNLQHEMGPLSRILLTIMGTYHKLNLSRLVTATVKDKKAFYASIYGLLEYPFENVIVGHGEDISRREFEGLLKTQRDKFQ